MEKARAIEHQTGLKSIGYLVHILLGIHFSWKITMKEDELFSSRTIQLTT